MSSIKKILEVLVAQLSPATFQAVRSAILDSVHLTGEPVEVPPLPPGATKLGGQPDLPKGAAWPTREGAPLSFIAQVNLMDLHALAGKEALPSKGLLSFFYDAVNQPWGEDPEDAGGAAVLFTESLEALTARDFPDTLAEAGRFPTRKLVARAELTLPKLDSQDLKSLELTDKEIDAFIEVSTEEPGVSQHRLLGHPDALQGDMQLQAQLVSHGLRGARGSREPRAEELERGARDWRLLLQVDSDEDAGMSWGDGGRIYFWIREEDLVARRFEKTWTILQCD